MNKNGFTLVELLGSLFIFGIIITMGLYFIGDTFSQTKEEISKLEDSEIYNAVYAYVIENNKEFIDGYLCIDMQEVKDMGYINNIDKYKYVGIYQDIDTKVIKGMEYV